jgi:hypothetical protein
MPQRETTTKLRLKQLVRSVEHVVLLDKGTGDGQIVTQSVEVGLSDGPRHGRLVSYSWTLQVYLLLLCLTLPLSITL